MFVYIFGEEKEVGWGNEVLLLGIVELVKIMFLRILSLEVGVGGCLLGINELFWVSYFYRRNFYFV